jgi:hypothetical protein
MILRMQATVSGRARCPKQVPSSLPATLFPGLDTTLADEAMADPRVILSCNDGVKRNAQSVVQGDRLLPSCLDYDSRSIP